MIASSRRAGSASPGPLTDGGAPDTGGSIMFGQFRRVLAVAAVVAVALGPDPAAAVTPLNACADLTKTAEVYTLTADIVSNTSDGICFKVLADRITVDLAEHTI